MKAVTFRRFGPSFKGRFDHDKFGTPRYDPNHGVLYGAFKFETSLVEVFGDTRLIEYDEKRVAIITLTRDVQLLDLVDGAMAAGTVAAIASVTSRRLSQSWSRYIYGQTGVFGTVDGLYYNGAHNSGKCVLLYERAEDAVECAEKTTSLLSDPKWRPGRSRHGVHFGSARSMGIQQQH
jgi:RES domain